MIRGGEHRGHGGNPSPEQSQTYSPRSRAVPSPNLSALTPRRPPKIPPTGAHSGLQASSGTEHAHRCLAPCDGPARSPPPRFADANLGKTPPGIRPVSADGGRANRARDGGSPSRGERAGIWGARGGMRECFGLALLKKIWPPEMAM